MQDSRQEAVELSRTSNIGWSATHKKPAASLLQPASNAQNLSNPPNSIENDAPQRGLDLRAPSNRQEFYSMAELAARWRCSRGTVYNRLRQMGAKVLDFSIKGKKSKKAVPAVVVLQIEARQMKRLA